MTCNSVENRSQPRIPVILRKPRNRSTRRTAIALANVRGCNDDDRSTPGKRNRRLRRSRDIPIRKAQAPPRTVRSACRHRLCNLVEGREVRHPNAAARGGYELLNLVEQLHIRILRSRCSGSVPACHQSDGRDEPDTAHRIDRLSLVVSEGEYARVSNEGLHNAVITHVRAVHRAFVTVNDHRCLLFFQTIRIGCDKNEEAHSQQPTANRRISHVAGCCRLL
jgi:hypothetical protein